jgi:ankyrin repeat protein
MGDARAIVTAAKEGDLEEVRRLVQQDRGLLEAIEGYTPLTAAAWGGHVEVIQYLLEEGAQVNLQDVEEFSALICACHNGQIEAIHLLLAHGADTAITDYMGSTPLMTASEEGHTDVVAVLLAHGCGDVDRERPSDDRTALHCACLSGHMRVVRALLGAGADPHVVEGEEGLTPLAMAVQMGREECVAILQVRGCGIWHVADASILMLGPMGVVQGGSAVASSG